MAYIGLQPVDGQHRAPPGKQSLGDSWAVQHMQAHQLFVALDQVGHAPLADPELTRLQGAMDLGHAAVLAKALGTHAGDDVKANLAMRQRSAALLFGTVGPTEQRTAVGTAPTDLQPQAHPASEGQDRALLPIAGPERATAADALASIRDQRSRQVGCGLCMCASHGSAPQSNQIPPLPQKPGRAPLQSLLARFFFCDSIRIVDLDLDHHSATLATPHGCTRRAPTPIALPTQASGPPTDFFSVWRTVSCEMASAISSSTTLS